MVSPLFMIMSRRAVCKFSFSQPRLNLIITIVQQGPDIRTAAGYYYPLSGHRRQLLQVQYAVHDNVLVGARPLMFTPSYLHPVVMHAAVISIGKDRFFVYGWHRPVGSGHSDVAVNQTLLAIKRGTIWNGEVLVLVIGKRYSFQQHPRVKRKLIDEAAAL